MSLKKLKKIVPSWAVSVSQLAFIQEYMKKYFGLDLLKKLEENYEKSLKNYEVSSILGSLFREYVTPEEIVYFSVVYKDGKVKEAYLIGNIPDEYINGKPRLSWKLIFRSGILGIKNPKLKNETKLIERALESYKIYFKKAKIIILAKHNDQGKGYATASFHVLKSDESLHEKNGDFLPYMSLKKELGLDNLTKV